MNTESHTATIRFGTREPYWLYKKKPGETTTIFQMADHSLQKQAQETNEPYTLLFDTSNSNLKQWLDAQNNQLNFDEVSNHDETTYHVWAKKVYQPGVDTG